MAKFTKGNNPNKKRSHRKLNHYEASEKALYFLVSDIQHGIETKPNEFYNNLADSFTEK